MSKGRATFRKRDLKVAREVAHEGDIVEARPDGTIVIITGRPAPEIATKENPWDEVLPHERH